MEQMDKRINFDTTGLFIFAILIYALISVFTPVNFYWKITIVLVFSVFIVETLSNIVLFKMIKEVKKNG